MQYPNLPCNPPGSPGSDHARVEQTVTCRVITKRRPSGPATTLNHLKTLSFSHAQYASYLAPFGDLLRPHLRGEVYTDPTHRGLYATDASHYQMMPACVVVPRDEENVKAVVEVAQEQGMPIIPFLIPFP